MKGCVRPTMAFPAFPESFLWTLCSLTILSATVHSNVLLEDDPFQPLTTDETVSVGGTVTLTCSVMESDNSSLQWSNTAQQTLYFGDKRALRDNRIQLHRSTATELSITIAEVQLSDEGDYTCSIFTRPIRTTRATVTVLGVPGKPRILSDDDDVQEGGTIILTCSSSGSKPPAKLRWYRGEEELTGWTDTVLSDPDERTYTVKSQLQLTVTRDDNNVKIACAVDHPSLTGGDERTEQALRVLFSPRVQIQPESDLPREGERFHLECVGTGNPDPASFHWEKKDGALPPLAKVDGSFLRFELLNKSDNGVYLCQVDNVIGKGQADYTLLVQGHPNSNSLFPTSLFTPSIFPLYSSSPSFPSSSPSSSPSLVSTSLSHTSLSSFTSSSPSSFISTFLSTSPSPSSTFSNSLFSLESSTLSTSFSPSPPSLLPSSLSPSLTPSSAPIRLNGLYSFTEDATDNTADPTAMSTSSGVDHAVIGGVVAVIVFILLCLLIVLGRYLIRHKGTYLTHEAKGSDDAPDADTAIINAEGGHSGADDKKEYFI